MNGSLSLLNDILLPLKSEHIASACVGVCPPAAYLSQTLSMLSGSDIKIGAQTLNEHASGAYTGEISGSMLKELGCTYVLVGHSERRAYYGETVSLIAGKFAAAIDSGLTPVLCIGETQEERDNNQATEVVFRQIDAILERVGKSAFENAVISYEPVWAIGTGKTATPEQAQEVHAFIRNKISALDSGIDEGLRILYGGSMNPGNAAELFAQPDIDGGLIGGASLKSEDFLVICKAAK